MVEIILSLLALLFVLATVLPLIEHDQWWIRIFDFPRGQIAIGGVLVTLAYALFTDWAALRTLDYVVLALLTFSVAYQGYRMLPYTRVWPKQSQWADEVRPEQTLSLLIANVLMTNRDASRLISLIRDYDPDLVLTVETDDWWAEQLEIIEDDYPHTVKEPLPNTYGMLLYSRLALDDPEAEL